MYWIGLALLLALLGATPLPAQTALADLRIDTFAGSDSVRDGGPASQGLLDSPAGVATDASGNIYIADQGNRLLRRVGPDGQISTVAGTIASLAVGTVATQSAYVPSCVAVSPDDRVHFCSSRQVFELLPDGTARVVAGTGGSGGAGDEQPAVDAGFSSIADIAFGPDGSLYILDQQGNQARRVSPDGMIHAFAGTGDAGYSGDGGPAVDALFNRPLALDVASDGAVLICDTNNHRIRRVAADGTVTTVAGTGTSGSGGNGGPASEAALSFPSAVAAAADGSYSISGFNDVRKVGADGMIQAFAGRGASFGDGGPATQASFEQIRGLHAASDGALLIATGDRIRRVAADGTVNTVAGAEHLQGDGGPATQAVLYEPRGMALDDAGNLYIADVSNYAVRRVAPDGTITTVAGGLRSGPYGQDGPATEVRLRNPTDVAIHPVSGELYILDASDGRVRRVDAAGRMTTVVGTGSLGNSGDGGPATQAQIQFVQSLSFDAQGDLYLADLFANVVRKVSGGIIWTVAGTGSAGYAGDGGQAVSAQINRPSGAVVNAAGELFILESNRIRRVGTDGVIVTLVTLVDTPTDLSLTPGGDLLASVPNLNRVLRIRPNGAVEEAGRFGFGYFGDGGSAARARLYEIGAALEAPDGRIFLADQQNDRIRVLGEGPVLPNGAVRQAASFFQGAMSPETILSVFGSHLAEETAVATETPLPTSLGGTQVFVRDSQGEERAASLFFVSPGQINLMVPAGTANGGGALIVRTASGAETQADLNIVSATPGLFSANADGVGVAAAFALRADAAGVQTTEPVFQLDEAQNNFVDKPLSLGPEGDQVYLILFGTGLRGADRVNAHVGNASIPVAYFGPQGGFVGLDQVNIGPLPRTLIGQGSVEVSVDAIGRSSNFLSVTIE
ncbi:MAG: hypothetical protein GC160_09850 [Acidobacteria bacterium]|nr:hypothetical protein [Acidobacteriota bacterium]